MYAVCGKISGTLSWIPVLAFRLKTVLLALAAFINLFMQVAFVYADENNPPADQILDNSGRGGLPTPPVLKGPLPPNTQGLPTPARIQAPETPQAKAAATKLDEIVEDAIRSMGAIFVDQDDVIVKPPLLTALIRVDEHLDPYALESAGSKAISLHDVLNAAYGQNLNIKISGADSDKRKWAMLSSAGSFLPSLVNEITYQGIGGNYISPAGAAIPINNYYMNTSNSFSQYLYKGGGILHTFLENKHLFKASKHAVKLVSNDVLLETAKQYYKLALNEVLLQIKIKSVQTGDALYLINKDLYANGVNTMLEVLQAKTQLSMDRQELIKQQIERRQSAVDLATTINEDSGTDLTLGSPKVGKVRLVDKSLTIKDLLKIAVENRPELKRYEELRLAAIESIKVAKAPLLPQVMVTGSTVGTFSRIFDQNTQQQQTPFTTSGGASATAVSGASSLPVASGSNTSSGSRHSAGRSLFLIGVDMQWQLGGMGLTAAGKVQEARAEARRRQLEFSRELNKVYKEVRDSYLSVITAENLIIETTDMVNSSKEQLRIAKDRLENGVGTNLDVVQAQRDYTRALVEKAKALIEFNSSEAQLLRDIGRITVNSLVASSPLRN